MFYLRRRATTDLAFDKSQKIKTALAILIPSLPGLLWLEFIYRAGGVLFFPVVAGIVGAILATISFLIAVVLSKERRVKYGVHAAGLTFQIIITVGLIRIFAFSF